jgi:hypothetical protein
VLAARFFMGMSKRKLTDKVFSEILQLIAEGKSLRSICDKEERFPAWRTVLQYVKDNEEAYVRYRKARIDQAESLRDYLLELTQRPLPVDKQFANAEVQRRKLEADVINRLIGTAQNRGLRDKAEDKPDQPTTLTIKWGEDGAEVTDDAENNGLNSTAQPQRSARDLH